MEEKEDILVIEFKALFSILWNYKWWIVFITSIFTVLGGIYAFTAREEFVSEGKLLPELSGGGGSSLGGIANLIGMGGFEMGMKNNTEAIRPDLYPDLLKSSPFFLELFQQNVITRTNNTFSFEEFYHNTVERGKEIEEKKTIKFPVKDTTILIVSRLNEERIADLKRRIVATIDKKNGVITISVKMPDPVVAAQLAYYSMDYLTKYVTSYRTMKAKREVDFLGEKVRSARGKFYSNQLQKAQYSDQFQAPTIRLQSADVRRERIESEYKMSSGVFNELLKKYEEAKIKLQQETPVFQILEPPTAPTFKSEPKKAFILIASTFLGVLIAIILILIVRIF